MRLKFWRNEACKSADRAYNDYLINLIIQSLEGKKAMTKHTPGPWNVIDNNDIRDAQGNNLADIVGARTSQDTDCANARLIAKAPEMLEVLEAILLNTEDRTCVHSSGSFSVKPVLTKPGILTQVRNLIDEARGEARGNGSKEVDLDALQKEIDSAVDVRFNSASVLGNSPSEIRRSVKADISNVINHAKAKARA